MRFWSIFLGFSMLVTAAPPSDPIAPTPTPPPPARVWAFDLLSEAEGWLLTDRALYFSRDGGDSWRVISPRAAGGFPLATADFLDPQQGWLLWAEVEANGAPHYTLAQTTDGGAQWHTQALAFLSAEGPPAAFWLTRHDAARATLTVKRATSINFDLRATFVTADGGQTWARAESPEKAQGTPSQTMFNDTFGWRFSHAGACAGGQCAQTATLARTRDGGQTWAALAVPGVGQTITLVVGQAFDACTIPEPITMQTWLTESPYRVVNLYIGGVSRGCQNRALSSGYINQLADAGWRFIPTWVGPQAACSGFTHRMSYNVSTAYAQGRAEATAALSVANYLGLVNFALTDTILYYDLESYPDNAPCREAARAFMNGWAEQLHASGNLAGVYGSPCSSYLTDFVANTHIPDAIWIAAWQLPAQYRPNASVWNVACLDNSLWVDHQRLRQYAGDHNETWGGVTLNIDSNVLDGPVDQPDVRRVYLPHLRSDIAP